MHDVAVIGIAVLRISPLLNMRLPAMHLPSALLALTVERRRLT